MNVTRDIAYLGPDRKHKLDLYEPAGANEPLPGVVIIHGGGWRVGDKADLREAQIAQTLVAAAYACVSINYTQIQDAAPPWPAYLHDARKAALWLRARPGVDPKRVGAIGGSAGGNMALLLGAAADGFEPVKAIVALYPPTDMGWAGKSREALLGHSAADRPDVARAASPLFVATKDFPPTFLLHGTEDKIVPLDHSQRMADRLEELDVPCELTIVQGAPHTFKLHEPTHDFRADVVNFFNRHLRPD